MQKAINKISYLDGIRGVAAFIVLIHHFLLAFYPAYYTFDESTTHLNNWDVKFGRSLYSVFVNGNFCVFIFFVLSGLVLSRNYFGRHSREVLISGAQRRFIRLYIPVAFTICLAAIMMKAGLFFNHPVSIIAHSEWWFANQWAFTNVWEQFYQCMLYKTMFTIDSTFDTAMWTMSIEFYCSLFVFAFLALTHGTRNRITMLLLCILYSYYTNNPFLSAFCLGISLNYTDAAAPRLSRRFTVIAPVILLVLGLGLGSFPSNGNIHHTFYGRTPDFILFYFNANWFHGLGAYLVVLSFLISPRLQRFISLRLFRFLGYISFALYLLHPLVIGSVGSYLFLHIHDRFGYNHSVLYVFLLVVAVCALASWLMTRYIDGPGIKFAKYIYTRFVKDSTKPVY